MSPRKNPMKKIVLFKSRHGWMARHTDPEILAVMGTNLIPTAYTSLAPPDVVLAAIRKLNPLTLVELK